MQTRKEIAPESETGLSGPTIALDPGDTLANAIRRRLADQILNREFDSETRLDEQEMARRFGVSRTPVREALKQLESAGLVEIRPRRGAVVVQVDSEKLGYSFEATAELEAIAAGWAAMRAKLDERKALLQLVEEGEKAMRSEDSDWFSSVNRRFHALLSDMARNPSLADAISLVRVQTAPFQRAQFRHPEQIRKTQAEHERIANAVFRQDGESARRFMKEHILRASLTVLEAAAPRTPNDQ